MTPTRVLYLSYDGMTDPLGQSQVISYLKRIANPEILIDIISFEKPEVFGKNKQVVDNALKGTVINWYPLMYTKTPPVISTLTDIRAGWAKIKELNSRHPYDIVHCRGYITAILGKRMKATFGTRFIFDMRGWWADEKIESGFWNNPVYKVVYKYFKGLEKSFFQTADKVISLTYVGKDEIVNNKWKQAEDIGVIPTCVDFNTFKPFSSEIRKEVREELGIPAKANVLLYSGSLGGNYDVSEIISFYEAFSELHPESYFLIITKSDPILVTSHIAAKGNIDPANIIIRSAEYRDVHKYLMAADFGLILYKLTYSVIGRCPTKMGEYWACGLPVISLKGIGDLDNILQKYPEGGILAESLNKSDIKEAFRKAEATDYDKNRLRKIGEDYFSIDNGVSFYTGVYHDLMAETETRQVKKV